MRHATWHILEEIFSRTPILKAEEVEFREIAAAEHEVRVVLADDYKEFIHRYGGAIVGPFPIFGLRKALPMGRNEGDFIVVTKSFRQQGWPGVENWVIISIDHVGNPVGLDSQGQVWISDHDARAVQVIAASFEAFLRKLCLRLAD